MVIAAKQFVDRNALDEFVFVGNCGEKVTTNADRLLALLARKQGINAAALFALPRFDENRTSVMWFAQTQGPIIPFGELDDPAQSVFLDRLDHCRSQVSALVDDLADQGENSGDRALYRQLLPLLLNFPEPVEYHLFQVGNQPVVVNWGMNKGGGHQAADTVTPFIQLWRQRLDLRARQAREQAEAARREASFLGRLTRAGARSGQITVSLLWNDANDLDLHVQCPDGSTINFMNKLACGGILDVDRNAHPQSLTREPVENITWTSHPSLKGEYRVMVHFFRQHDGNDRSAFSLRLKTGGKTTFFTGEVAARHMAEVTRFVVR